MTQKTLSEHLFISTSTLNGYLNSSRTPPMELLVEISRKLGVTCDYLLGNNDERLAIPEDLSKEESIVIDYFRKLDVSGREMVKDTLIIYLEHHSTLK